MDSDEDDVSSGSYISESSSEFQKPKASSAKQQSYLDESDSDAISDSDEESSRPPPKKKAQDEDELDDDDYDDDYDDGMVSDSDEESAPAKKQSSYDDDDVDDGDNISDSDDEESSRVPPQKQHASGDMDDEPDVISDSEGNISDSGDEGGDDNRAADLDSGSEVDDGSDVDMGGGDEDEDAISDSDEGDPVANNKASADDDDVDMGGGDEDEDAISDSDEEDPVTNNKTTADDDLDMGGGDQDEDAISDSDEEDPVANNKTPADDDDLDMGGGDEDEDAISDSDEEDPVTNEKAPAGDDDVDMGGGDEHDGDQDEESNLDSDEDDKSLERGLQRQESTASVLKDSDSSYSEELSGHDDEEEFRNPVDREADAPVPAYKEKPPTPPKKEAEEPATTSPKKKSVLDSTANMRVMKHHEYESDDSTSEKKKAASCTAPPKKKSVLDSDSEYESDDSTSEKKKTKATTPAPKSPPKKKSVLDSDCEYESDDSTSEKKTKAAAPAPKSSPKKKSVLESDSEYDSDDSTSKKKAKAAPPGPSKKKSVLDSDSEYESDDSTSEKKKAKATAPAQKSPPKKKSVLESSDEESDESTSEKKKAKAAAPAQKSPPKKKSALESSDEESDDSTSEKKKAKATAPAQKSPPKKKSALESSDEESDESTSEKKTKATTPAPKQKPKSSLDDSDSDEESSSTGGKAIATTREKPSPIGDDTNESRGEAQLCSACGAKAAYFTGGMSTCSACHNVSFRASWTGDKGKIDKETLEDTAEECHACGMESDYVSEGMIYCSACHEIPYCSIECKQWHWNEGHKKECTGIADDERRVSVASSSLGIIKEEDEGSEQSIDAFDPGAENASNEPQSAQGVMAALAKARAEATAKTEQQSSPAATAKSCQSCGTQEEFAPDGMKTCVRCFEVTYCSVDCMEWHWVQGGHKMVCKGATEAERKGAPLTTSSNDSDGSIDAFGGPEEVGAPESKEGLLAALAKARAEAQSKAQAASIPKDKCKACGPEEVGAPESKEGLLAALAKARAEAQSKAQAASIPKDKCKACGVEKEFVPDGMIMCSKCSQVPYCSVDCMEWDWEGGGHSHSCGGVSVPERTRSLQKPTHTGNDSEGSIVAFDPNAEASGGPKSKEGVLAALAAARTQTAAAAAKKPAPMSTMKACISCGMDKEFVPEGLQTCPKCSQVPYCSKDCMVWHWNSGGHKDECTGTSTGGGHTINQAPSHDSEGSIDAFDPNAANAKPQSIMAALAKAREEAAAATASSSKTPSLAKPRGIVQQSDLVECKACGMDEEFVSEGMRSCPRCKLVPYCSLDCMSWHWEVGGHSKECPGLSDDERNTNSISNAKVRDDNSIEAFSLKSDGAGAPPTKAAIIAALSRSKDGPVKCKACGMDKEFVPEGMHMCPKCRTVPYCSEDCMKWDWNSGGHKSSCPGASVADRSKDRAVVLPDDGDDGSIEAFGGHEEAPQGKEGILAALSKARAEVAAKPPAIPSKCEACGTEAEFVPEGMKTCPKCNGVSYCSDDCMKWHWGSGGHKDKCPGVSVSTAEKKKDNMLVVHSGGESDGSIEAFDAGAGTGKAPQSQAGVLAALSKAREEAAASKAPSSALPLQGATSSPPPVRDQITAGAPAQNTQYIPQQGMLVAPPSSSPSIREQITGGRAPPSSTQPLRDQITGMAPASSAPAYDTNMLKLELERTKRQYNDAMLSKAALERTLNDITKAAAVPPRNQPAESHDGISQSIDSFLRRLEGLLEADRTVLNKTHSQVETLTQQNAVAPAGALAQSVVDLEDSIQGLVAKSRQAAADKDALKKAINEAEMKASLLHGAPTTARGHSWRGQNATQPVGSDRGKDAMMRDLSHKWDDIVAESDYLKAQLDQTTRERDQMRAEKEATERVLQEKEALLAEVCKTIVDLENEVSRIYGEQKSLESQNEKLRRRLDQLTKELAQMHIDKDASDELLREKEAMLNELAQLAMELEAQILTIDGEKKSLQGDLQQAFSALTKHREAKDRLEKSFTHAEKEIRGLRLKINDALQATNPAYSIGSTLSSKPEIPVHQDYFRQPVYESDARDEVGGPTPARNNTSNTQGAPFAYSDRAAALNLPSQRQDAIGHAIRQRTGTPQYSGEVRSAAPKPEQPPLRQNIPEPAPQTEEWVHPPQPNPPQQRVAVPERTLPHTWTPAAPIRQRDGAKEPKGIQFTHDYGKPLRRQVAPPISRYYQRSDQESNAIKRDRLPPAPSFPPPQVAANYISAQNDPRQAAPPQYAPSSRSRDNYRGRDADRARQVAPPVVAANPRQEQPKTTKKSTMRLPLTPTEQRMAIIQQKIAEKVAAARRAPGATSKKSQSKYSQPSAPSQSSLRPQYGKAPASRSDNKNKNDIFRNRLEELEPPSLRRPSQLLHQTTAPSYSHLAPKPTTRAAAYKPPAPSGRMYVVAQPHHSYQNAPSHQYRRADPSGGYRHQTPRLPKEIPHAPPRYVIQSPYPGGHHHVGYASSSRPQQYAVTHHVDPKNLQKVRDERWRQVLSSSSALS
ncbi:Inherit from COG: Hemolysin-type calcium-binding [Seminavis robusta]|uniref:phytol kinase n=1 Tax=Seminavis robusta TaxID=568900 RepID=A0A9N8HCB7_9STRA|nr:Inherit from COG: Hemolysin-type calcium-binding [Seminavis robusta]|eukprot:Sro375_g129400.1 Inherit from COG: Hemolysin-type calcium-binding (2516) ;mRNA; r:19366-27115